MTKSHKILLTFPFVILNIVIEGENMYINQLVKKNLQSKVEANKSEKMNNLLDSAFKLFVDKGIKKTSIQDIVDQAGVAKGTFYLYFKDKYELQDVLLVRTSRQLFNEAYSKLKNQEEQPLEDKEVLVVEDIIDSGRTLSYLLDVLKRRNPNSVKLCTLLDKPDRRVVKGVDVDYCCFNIPDEFVVGYGLDYAQKYRNLPYIGVVEFE